MRKISAAEMPINLAARSDVYIVNPESYVRSLLGQSVRVDYEGIPVIGTITESSLDPEVPGVVRVGVRVPIPRRHLSEIEQRVEAIISDPESYIEGVRREKIQAQAYLGRRRKCGDRNPTGSICTLPWGHAKEGVAWHTNDRSRWPAVDLRGRHARPRRRTWWRWS